jgi:hypothetical protein
MSKEISVVFYSRRQGREDWVFEISEKDKADFFAGMEAELAPFGILVRSMDETEVVMEVGGYGDVLNSVRIRSPRDGISNLCLGHIIGASPNRNLFDDIRRGINRVAFAPETIEPEGSEKIVCHNCGCGC